MTRWPSSPCLSLMRAWCECSSNSEWPTGAGACSMPGYLRSHRGVAKDAQRLQQKPMPKM